ncbi:uromodulin-like [Rhinoderma darwinii]|uniref:uromodulin-like n=1 Tax=Rhinoderma darwinii TaxID=43563 RepID=UPI003F661BF0
MSFSVFLLNVRLVLLRKVLSYASPECPVLYFSRIMSFVLLLENVLSCVSPECPLLCFCNGPSCVSPECVPSYVCFSRMFCLVFLQNVSHLMFVSPECSVLCFSRMCPILYAKSCSFCNTTNSNCEARVGYVICTCKPGFIGNGLNCTRMAFCDIYKCCPDGYTWDAKNKLCADINECLTPTLNKCSPRETCINRNGIYLCVPNTSALCSGTACSSNQDCLKINDSFQCADPCDYYDLLNGDNKLSSIESTGRFITDRYNFGWFRYVGRITASLKVGAVGTFKCGSLEPFSLGGDHPDIGDGIKSVPIISNLLTGSVRAGSIPVKACARGYYVYKYSGMLKYDVYCTGKISAGSCTKIVFT